MLEPSELCFTPRLLFLTVALQNIGVFTGIPPRAASLPDPVPRELIRARSQALHELGQRLKQETLERYLGRRMQVLVEDRQLETGNEWSGYTPNFLRVALANADTQDRDLSNRILDVTLTGIAPEGDRLQASYRQSANSHR